MSNFIYYGGHIPKTRTVRYGFIYNRLRNDYQVDPESASLFYPTNDYIENNLKCICFKIPKPVIDPSTYPPAAIRLSNIIKNGQCYSKTQYANASVGRPFYVNYLGRTPGQPGGGGSPPKNVLQ